MPKGLKGFQIGNNFGKNNGQYEGRVPWNKGLRNAYKRKPHSDLTKRKIGTANSIKQKGRPKLWLRKDKHHIDESKIWRTRIEYRLWREAVFARDNWTCKKCNKTGGRIHPHHIFNFANYIELRFAIDNGITLCVKCHKEFHRIYGKKNNNREQLDEWLYQKTA